MSTIAPITAAEWRRLEAEGMKCMKKLREQGAEFTMDATFRVNLFTGEREMRTDLPCTFRLTLPEPKPEALLPEHV